MRSNRFLSIAVLATLSAILVSEVASAQRLKWKRSKPETLYARNKKKQVSPIYIGIGTKTPTAQLHTIGTVRFEGLQINNSLNSVVAVDGNGNLYWRDISNTNSNAWLLGGNSIGASNFFGTTNNQDIRIRTNNNQRAVITSTGLVGIGVATPSAQLHTNSSVRFEGLTNNDVLNRLLAMDADGNLSWRNASSLNSNDWTLTGNSAAATSFLGTTNNENLRIRVNNIERVVITNGGAVGIGVSAPTSQLHTNGTVRFEGIMNDNSFQRLALFDNNGNLFYRDVASLQSNFWSLTGNTGTNPATNFLGTTDNNRLVIRTNNIERMTVLADGKVGINNTNPIASLVVNSSVPDNHLRIQGVAPSITFEGSPGVNNEGRIGYATQNNNFVNGSLPGDLIVQTLSATANLIFGTTGGGTGNGVERARINASGFFGIGTQSPTALFHTNGTIRFQNLTSGTGNPLVADANGNVFIGTASAATGWALTGNIGTNPATNYLGTNDNNRLVIRTNNIERMTVLADGRVGINNSNPIAHFVVNSSVPDNHIRIQGVAPSIIFEGSPGPNNEGRIGYATQNNNYVNGALPGDLIVQTLGATANLIFGTTGGGTGNGVERARINASGFFGIGTQSPTALLHTNGTVRFQNLPPGTGNALVMDINGNVFRSTTLTGREVTDLQGELASLKKEIEELRAVINSMKGGTLSTNEENKAVLYQNTPNPFRNTTIIRYYLPVGTRNAIIQLSDLQGTILKTYRLFGDGEQTLALNGGELSAGTYFYTLLADGKKTDSKKMILTR